MKYFFYLALATIILFSCTTKESTERGGQDYNIETITSHRQYYLPGSDEPFRNEYGRTIRYIGKDTLLLEFCKDSSVALNKSTGEILRNSEEFCYPMKEVFIDGEYKINPELHQVGKAYRRNSIKSVSEFSTNDKTYKIFRLKSLYYSDESEQLAFLHTNEYWNSEIGLLLKADEHFGRGRRRLVLLKDAQVSGKSIEGIQDLIQKIRRDSADWITLNKEGSPMF